MAHYENQSDMFMKRAESCKKNGDRFYAQAKQTSNKDQYNQLMAQAQAHYQSQKENEAKAKAHSGKTFKWFDSLKTNASNII